MGATDLFVDTSGWGNFLVRDEALHALASGLLRRRKKRKARVITTNYVLTELVALLTSPLRVPRPLRFRMLEELRSAPWIEVIHITPDLDEAAWSLLRARPDKDWSLVDCASFVVMRERGIAEALTTDRHFEQAGFARLLD